MIYHVNVPGMEGRQVAVETTGMAAKPKLLLDGLPAPAAPQRNRYLLRRNDGSEAVAYFRSAFPDTVPVLMVGDQTIRLLPPLQWYELTWASFPLLLIFVGGAIGGVLGAVAASINVSLFRSQQNPALRYGLTGLVSLVAIVLWVVVVVMLRGAMSASHPA